MVRKKLHLVTERFSRHLKTMVISVCGGGTYQFIVRTKVNSHISHKDYSKQSKGTSVTQAPCWYDIVVPEVLFSMFVFLLNVSNSISLFRRSCSVGVCLTSDTCDRDVPPKIE